MSAGGDRHGFALRAAGLLLCITCMVALAGGQGLPGLPNTMSVVVQPPFIQVNGGVASITATVYDTNGSTVENLRVIFSNSETQLGTLSVDLTTPGDVESLCPPGCDSCTCRYTNSDGVTTVLLTAGTTTGTEKIRVWVGSYQGNPNLDKTVTVNITTEDLGPPLVVNPSANPATILNDNGRPRAAGTNRTQINVTVTDDAGVASVTINFSAIGGSATQSMTKLAGTNVWTVTTNATAGINTSRALTVNATDIYGKVNNTVKVALEVLRRGDVVRDNVSDMKDVLYIARYTVGLEPEVSNPPAALVADVVGNAGDSRGDGKVDMKDVLYLAKWIVGQEPAP